MKLSISNIAWDASSDEAVYTLLQSCGFQGLEIAPTRIFAENPYEKLEEAKDWSARIKDMYGLSISSMQSIWYGRSEKIFSTKEERIALLKYTKKAILFAEMIGCKNIVFGNPKNRDTEDVKNNYKIARAFFRELGDYALDHNTVLAFEPNPTIYNTRFINTTIEAFELVEDVQSEGFKVNIDIGTIIQNNETVLINSENSNLINHVHVSEPFLEIVKERTVHQNLSKQLKNIGYSKFISIEMSKQNIFSITGTIHYVKNIFSATI